MMVLGFGVEVGTVDSDCVLDRFSHSRHSSPSFLNLF